MHSLHEKQKKIVPQKNRSRCQQILIFADIYLNFCLNVVFAQIPKKSNSKKNRGRCQQILIFADTYLVFFSIVHSVPTTEIELKTENLGTRCPRKLMFSDLYLDFLSDVNKLDQWLMLFQGNFLYLDAPLNRWKTGFFF